MNTEQNLTGAMAFIDSVGGADRFIWLVMFALLLVTAGVLLYINRNNME